MTSKRADFGETVTTVQIRIMVGDDIAIGPGKADLLEAIRDTGSISAAGRSMAMSYRRAWLLVDTMNACFETPLVETAKGGASGGGARLSPLGEQVLAHFRAMEAAAAAAIAPDSAAVAGLLHHK
jgi:molybdate transport system regulatory protein